MTCEAHAKYYSITNQLSFYTPTLKIAKGRKKKNGIVEYVVIWN